MTFIARILRYLVLVGRGFLERGHSATHCRQNGSAEASGPSRTWMCQTTRVNQKLVRDPVCGMHVAEGLALPLKQGRRSCALLFRGMPGQVCGRNDRDFRQRVIGWPAQTEEVKSDSVQRNADKLQRKGKDRSEWPRSQNPQSPAAR